MGLDVYVGWLAQAHREVGAEEFLELQQPFIRLNEILLAAGLSAHDEPLDIPDSEIFEARMWGYEGLHLVRRLAAYSALRGRAPTTEERRAEASEDPVVRKLENVHQQYRARRSRKWLTRIIKAAGDKPKFEHLLWHSDCEGFYVPQDFDDVVFDLNDRGPSIGGMVGSTQRLLEECRQLARFLELPDELEPESEELATAAEEGAVEGALWRVFGVESYCLAILIRGCELSLRHRAALFFT